MTLLDGAHTIFVAASAASTSNSRLNELCEYVHKGSVTGELSERLENARTKVLMNSDWRRDYMFLSDIKYEAHEDGKKEGIEIGRAEGREESRAEGRVEGREEGKIETLVSLVDEGFLYKEIAADKANMTVEEFEKQLKPCIS